MEEREQLFGLLCKSAYGASLLRMGPLRDSLLVASVPRVGKEVRE